MVRKTGRSNGFTLVELISTVLIVGILAVAVAPRFMDQQMFGNRGFYDESLAILRYAQKAAIAQRRNVCVAFSGTTITLTIAANTGSAAACSLNLSGPKGNAPFTVTATGSAKFTNTSGSAITPTNFSFNALGQASISQTFRVDGLSQDITIEQETGYVHS